MPFFEERYAAICETLREHVSFHKTQLAEVVVDTLHKTYLHHLNVTEAEAEVGILPNALLNVEDENENFRIAYPLHAALQEVED